MLQPLADNSLSYGGMKMTLYTKPHTAKGWGIAMAILTILIWAGWMLSMRAGLKMSMTTTDLALLRFGVTGLILLPLLVKRWSTIIQTPKRYLLGIAVGAGLPFFYLAGAGMQKAPVADAGLLITGTFPLFVTSFAVGVFKERLSMQRAIGLSAICAGVGVIMSISMLNQSTPHWQGHLLFLAASICWAIFTVSIRLSGLKPWEAAAWLCCASGTLLGLGVLAGLFTTNLPSAPLGELVWQGVVQVLLVGLVTGFSYTFAVRQLGAENTSAIGALTPVLVALGGVLWLAEPLGVFDKAGIALIASGVLLASGIRLPSWPVRRRVVEAS